MAIEIILRDTVDLQLSMMTTDEEREAYLQQLEMHKTGEILYFIKQQDEQN